MTTTQSKREGRDLMKEGKERCHTTAIASMSADWRLAGTCGSNNEPFG